MNEDLIRKWINTKANLDLLKKSELELRKQICEEILDGKIKGSRKAIFGRYAVTAVAKLNTKIDEELLRSLWLKLSRQERLIFKLKPSIIAKEYGKIPADSKVNQAISHKPGTPTLSLKEALNE